MKPHLLVPQQVPEFVRAEYPAFVEFLQAYYEWLNDEYSLGKFGDLIDIDKTVDSFVDNFRKQLDVGGVTTATAGNDLLYLKHIKELYAAKGSPAGYEFLFKLLFNQPSSTLTPWDYVLKPSEGQWIQDTSLLIVMTKGSAQALAGNPVIITDITGTTYRAFAKNVNIRGDGVVELFINRVRLLNRAATVATVDGANVAGVQTTTTKALIEKSGSGFLVGQVFEINSNVGTDALFEITSVDANGGIDTVSILGLGSGFFVGQTILLRPRNQTTAATAYLQVASINNVGGITSVIVTNAGFGFVASTLTVKQTYTIPFVSRSSSLIKVKTTDANGGITAVDIIRFGTGYASDFNIQLTPTEFIAPSQLRSRVAFEIGTIDGVANLVYATDDYGNPQNESGLIVRHDYTDLGTDYFSDGTYVGDSVARIQNTITSQPDNVDYASIKFRVQELCVYPGYYADGNSIIGENAIIQDSYYYQAYSYVTVVEESLDRYQDLLKQALHPIGTKQFADYRITSTFQLDSSFEATFNFIWRRDDIRDLLEVLETWIVTLTKELGTEITNVSDVFTRIVSYNRVYTDDVATADPSYRDVTKQATESLNSTDTFDRTVQYYRDFVEPLQSIDTQLAFDYVKDGVSDAYAVSDTSSVTVSFTRDFVESNITLSEDIFVGFILQPSDTATVSELFEILQAVGRFYVDAATASDTTISFDITNSLIDSPVASDILIAVGSFTRSIDDTTATSEVVDFVAGYQATDTPKAQDGSPSFTGTAIASDISQTSENYAFVTDKYTSDVAQVSTSFGGLYMEPFYVQQDTSYWYPGYLENERDLSTL